MKLDIRTLIIILMGTVSFFGYGGVIDNLFG